MTEVPLWYLCTCNDDVLSEKTNPDREIKYVDISNVDSKNGIVGFSEFTFSSAPSRARRLVKKGDIVVSTVRTYLEAIALVGDTYSDCVFSTGFAVLRPKNPKQSLAIYLSLKSSLTIYAINSQSKGVAYPGIAPAELMRIKVRLPKNTEYLSKLIFDIDSIILNKSRILEKLYENRQSLIAHIVTRGLDSVSPKRDSGISWIGEIPAHWKVGKLANVGKFQGGSVFPEAFQGVKGNPIPFYKVADLSQSPDDWHLYDSANTITSQQAFQLKATIVRPNCIVYAKIGAAMLLNKRRRTTAECCIDNNMTSFRPTGVLLDWAYFWLTFIDFGAFSCPATVPSLSEGRQGRIPILIPPYNEQEEISEFLKEKVKSIHAILNNVRQKIKVLNEFRSSSISNVIAGGFECNCGMNLINTEVGNE